MIKRAFQIVALIAFTPVPLIAGAMNAIKESI